MAQRGRSRRHHEVPRWLLSNFSWDSESKLWIGFKSTREIRPVSVENVFVRKDANTRISYEGRSDGTFQRHKSDAGERSLAGFDYRSSLAAREVLRFARQWRKTRTAAPSLSEESLELCKRLMVAQARRTRESQERTDIGKGDNDLYYDLYRRLAQDHGQPLPPKAVLLQDPEVISLFNVITQNTRANFASGDHPILAKKEFEFLLPLGLSVAVLDPKEAQFVIGSHGITISPGENTWLPLAPDVAISFSNTPGSIAIGMYSNNFVDHHNRSALLLSAQIAGQSRGAIERVLGSLV